MVKNRARDPKRVPKLGISEPISHVKVLPKSSKSKFVYGDMTQSDVDEFESKINPGLKKGHANWESIQDYAERKRPAE